MAAAVTVNPTVPAEFGELAALVSAQTHFTALSNASDAEAAARDAVLSLTVS